MRDEVYCELRRSLDEERVVAMATVIRGPRVGRQLLVWPDGTTRGELGSPIVSGRGVEAATAVLRTFSTERVEIETEDGPVELFVETFPPRPKLVVVGAVHVAIPLVRMAAALDFRTVVVDPRSAFATRDRFSEADELVVEWPHKAIPEIGLHAATYVAVLTHDLKIDVPALTLAVRSPARYVGVLGSRKTHARRVAKLREAGLTDEDIARIRAPIGLDLGGRRPEEIAVAILAEIVAASHGVDPKAA